MVFNRADRQLHPCVVEPWLIVPIAFLPDVGLRKGERPCSIRPDRTHPGTWRTTPGRAIRQRVVLRKLSRGLREFFDVVACAYDRWRMEVRLMAGDGESISLPEMMPFGLRLWDDDLERSNLRADAVKPTTRQTDAQCRRCCAPATRLLSMTTPRTKTGANAHATGRIDLMVAAIMAVGARVRTSPRAPHFRQTT